MKQGVVWSVPDGLDCISMKSVTNKHYTDVIMGTIASQITNFTIVYSTLYSDADQRKYQSSASLAFVWGIHRRPVNCPHKWPVTRKIFPFDDVIMEGNNGTCRHAAITGATILVPWSSFCNSFGAWASKKLQWLDWKMKHQGPFSVSHLE